MPVNLGLSVNDIVNVQVSLSPVAAQVRNFGSLLILGDSAVIDTNSRYRLYTSLAAVSADFGGTAPEYLAAALFFDQSPQPAQLYIGAWAANATTGTLIGGSLSAAQQALSNFTGITTGSLTISVNGTPHNITGVSFSGQTTLAGVAAQVAAAFVAGSVPATCTWNAVYSYFQVTSNTTGTGSSVSFATVEGAGVDISALLLWQSGNGGYTVTGIAAETPVAAVTIMANITNNWYGLMFAATASISDAQHSAVASFIQGQTVSRIYGVSTQESAVINTPIPTTGDVASLLQSQNYTRAFVQYSSNTPYVAAATFGIAFTVNFLGTNTTITLKFKQDIGVTAETLTETQAQIVNSKNANVFVNYNNQTAILQQGTMASGQFFDTVHGTDWLQNDIQTAVYNVLYTSTTKVPQTDAGVNQLVTAVASCCDQAAQNNLIAPGVWLGPPFGNIVTGQTLSKGYYIYAPPVATQSVAARAARQSPVITAGIKLAGAIHSVNVIVNVSN